MLPTAGHRLFTFRQQRCLYASPLDSLPNRTPRNNLLRVCFRYGINPRCKYFKFIHKRATGYQLLQKESFQVVYLSSVAIAF